MTPHYQKTQLLQLQPTPYCNLDCKYCYLPGRDRMSKMALQVPESTLKLLKMGGCLGSQLDIAWHAGEPLVLPVDYYAEAFDRIESVKPPDLRIRHNFQTNATLISDDFCIFAKERNVTVGVSLDGPAFFHDSNRPTRGGQESHKKVMCGIEKLKSHQIPVSIITVLTRAALDKPDMFFEYFADNGIERLCFNLEQIVGGNKKTSLDNNDTPMAVKRFFTRYFELLRCRQVKQWVREIDGRLGWLFNGYMSEEAQNKPLAIISVNWKGDISTFSPELLDINHPKLGSLVFGNVVSDQIADILKNEKFCLVNSDIQEGVTACREACSYFRVCGGGSPAKKLAENSTFASTETISCRLGIQIVTDVLLDIVDKASSNLKGGSVEVRHGV